MASWSGRLVITFSDRLSVDKFTRQPLKGSIKLLKHLKFDNFTNFRWQGGQSVTVEVQLGQVGQLLEAGRQQRDVGLGQVQSLSALLLAGQELSRKVKIG